MSLDGEELTERQGAKEGETKDQGRKLKSEVRYVFHHQLYDEYVRSVDWRT
jgi:hypothetical protein